MKTLIIVKEKDCEWLRPIFPGIHPLLVPICNKPFIEFLIDFAILAGSDALRLVSDGPLSEVEQYCDSGIRWGIAISYGSFLSSDDNAMILEKNHRYCSGERVLSMNGFVFIKYDKQHDYAALFTSLTEGEILSCKKGSLSLTGGSVEAPNVIETLPLSLLELDSLEVYYRLSMEILGFGESPYVIPGYSNEAYCHIGRNVVISKSAEIRKPVIIGNNVQIMSDSIIGPQAIIGNNVIIDRASTVSDSIVIEHTYIGEHLEVQNRIAAGNILIEPESGILITMDDPHLLTGIKKSRSREALFQSLVHRILAFLIIAVQLIPFLLLSPILKFQGRWKKSTGSYYTNDAGKTLTLTTTSINRQSLPGSIAAALSLDRFGLLFNVVSGQMAIIGSTPIAAKTDNSVPLLEMGSWYKAGVFSYAEAEEWPANGDERAIVERYFSVHGNPLLDIAMTIKAFFNLIHEIHTP